MNIPLTRLVENCFYCILFLLIAQAIFFLHIYNFLSSLFAEMCFFPGGKSWENTSPWSHSDMSHSSAPIFLLLFQGKFSENERIVASPLEVMLRSGCCFGRVTLSSVCLLSLPGGGGSGGWVACHQVIQGDNSHPPGWEQFQSRGG